MPPKNEIQGKMHVYLCIDEEKREINPIPVWCGSQQALDIAEACIAPIRFEAKGKILFKCFRGNKAVRIRKRQIRKWLDMFFGKRR